MYGAAARRLHDETKAAKMRLCKLEAAAIEALQLKLYSRAADAFEAVATDVVQDNLTAANATRLLQVRSVRRWRTRLMQGKVEIFAKRDPVGASPEKLFWSMLTGAQPPGCRTRHATRPRITVVVGAVDLSMLKVLNGGVKYGACWSRVERHRRR